MNKLSTLRGYVVTLLLTSLIATLALTLKNDDLECKYGFGILIMALKLNFATIFRGGLNATKVSHSRDEIRNKMLSLAVCFIIMLFFIMLGCSHNGLHVFWYLVIEH
jgi:hypothetical protein